MADDDDDDAPAAITDAPSEHSQLDGHICPFEQQEQED